MNKQWINLITFLAGLVGLVVSLVTLWRYLKKPGQSQSGEVKKTEEAIKAATTGTRFQNLNDLLLAQSLHETGIGTSRIYRERNNLFGMKTPQQRDTLATNKGTNDTYANFSTKPDSVSDLLIWLDMKNAPSTFDSVEEYAKFLKRNNYYTDSLENYTKAMNYFFNKYS